jgi:hypothetical protein
VLLWITAACASRPRPAIVQTIILKTCTLNQTQLPFCRYGVVCKLCVNPQEFRIFAPVLVRDNQVIANADGSSIDTASADATLMLYVPGARTLRYLVSSVPFESAVEDSVHLGKITRSPEGHNYLLLTSMPITVSDQVWVKYEADFKPSERMVRSSDARDDCPMFLVRSLSSDSGVLM